MPQLSQNARIFLTAGLLACIAVETPTWAQTQPPAAVNQQDEVVTINVPADAGVDDVLQILRSGDKAETNSYVTRAFELRNTTAYELKPYIEQAVATEKGVVRGAKTEAKDGAKSRYFLLVTTTSRQMPSIVESIEELDVPGFVNSQGRGRRAVRLRYRLASDVANVLRSTRLTSQAKVFADDKSNTLYFDDSEYVTAKADEYVEFFDVPAPQIEFDVRIVELSDSDAGQIGLDWDAWKRAIGGQFAFSANQFEGGRDFARLDTLLTLDANVLANFLNYTVTSGSGRLIQRSRINASNLSPAVISDLKRVPYQEYRRNERTQALLTEATPHVDAEDQRDSDEAAGGPRTVTIVAPVHNQLTELGTDNEGILVSIQPVIGTEMVTARIQIAVNTLSGYDDLDRPIIAKQDLTNEFRISDGEELLLGTLERESTVKGRRGIPGLRDIPVIKYLFSVESSRTVHSRLFILATPRFSNVAYDARSLAELKDRPILRIAERPVALDDRGLDEAQATTPALP